MEPNNQKTLNQKIVEIERNLLNYKMMIQGIQSNINELEKSLKEIIHNQFSSNDTKLKELNEEKISEPNYNTKIVVLDEKAEKKILSNNETNSKLNNEISCEEIIKINDNFKEKLFNYRAFKPTVKNTSNNFDSTNIKEFNKSDNNWLKKDLVNLKEQKRGDTRSENMVEKIVLSKLNEEQKISVIDELFDEERAIKSISNSDHELSIESSNNIEKNDISNFLHKKRIPSNTTNSKYAKFLRIKKEKFIPKKLDLTKRLNTNYKKDFEQNNLSDYSIEIKSIEDENDDEFYGLKSRSINKEGFINSKNVKDKKKNFKGHVCEICKNFYNVIGENIENICEKCIKMKTSYKFESTPQDFYDCNI